MFAPTNVAHMSATQQEQGRRGLRARLARRPRLVALAVTTVGLLLLATDFNLTQHRGDAQAVAEDLLQALRQQDTNRIEDLLEPYASDPDCRRAVETLPTVFSTGGVTATFAGPTTTRVSEIGFHQGPGPHEASGDTPTQTVHIGLSYTQQLGPSGYSATSLAYTDDAGERHQLCGS